jgi:hypothetical protein
VCAAESTATLNKPCSSPAVILAALATKAYTEVEHGQLIQTYMCLAHRIVCIVAIQRTRLH